MSPNKANFVNLFYTILILLLSPFILILFSPIFLFRWIISKIVPLLSKRLIKIIPLQSSACLQANPKLTSTFNIVITVTLNQKINFVRFLELVEKRVIYAQSPSGALLYPELQQCISIWMGYHWWTKCSAEFNLRNHVRKINCSPGKSAFEFQGESIQIPFDSEKSPWEVIVLETEDSKTTVLFKFHHAMGDGYAMFELIMKMVDVPCQRFVSKRFNFSWGKRFLLNISYPIRGTYELVKGVGEIKSVTTPWKVGVGSDLTTQTLFAKSNRIPIENFREINKKFCISSFVTYLLVITTGLRQFLLTKIPEEKIPEYFTAVVPIPAENHPGGLVNHFYFSLVKIPIGLKDLKEQVSYCSSIFEKTNVYGIATACKANSAISKIIAGLPLKMRGSKAPNPHVSLSMFPGPMNSLSMDGAIVESMNHMCNGADFIGILFALLTYNGGVEFVVTAGKDSTIFPDQCSVQELITSIEAQVDILRMHESVDLNHWI